MNRRVSLILAIALWGVMFCPVAGQVAQRPCGSDSMGPFLKSLVPQGIGGADFRPACRRHDACYDTPGANQRICDKVFFQDLKCACRNSRRPLKCLMVARAYYSSLKLGGQKAFDQAQAKSSGGHP